MKSGFGQWASVGMLCMSLAANVLAEAPLPGPGPAGEAGMGRSPLNARDEVRQTQPPRTGYYQDIPRRDGDYRRWQAGGPGQRPGGDWPGRPHGHGDGWGGGPQYRPGHRIDGFDERYWKIPYQGQDYFYSAGYWYRPYGRSYVVTTPPYGLRVDGLPDYAQEVSLNGQPLFIVSGVYYQYVPGSGQYVVVDPNAPRPTSPGLPRPAPGQAPTISAYPVNGQSPQQQEQDTYDCYRWAVSQSGFDPGNAPYAPAPQVLQAYQQTLGACLQARGYQLQPTDR
ncbi:DUF6515 family protein [Pseudomonas sp. RP23018S]|uniref:DUF6515 family protein n=1 Tax=Pseudomonas sp. RP23018S TaxID=3096037 RepID=UPI002ACA70A4|nr:DUF6515 family protein [Pseudomonas sp. RP23018S]MDZ5604497.1 DUF6515 family protein [Pseudomonas sp. RP23018S]